MDGKPNSPARARRFAAAAALALAQLAPAQGAEAPSAGEAATLQQQVLQFAYAASAAAPGLRVEIELGALDARLRLAPCERIEPYLPPSTRLWGKTRIGLRCAQGGKPWNVYLPLTVRVFGNALTAATALPAGKLLAAADLRPAEIDLADGAAALVETGLAVGRTLARPLAAGQGLRQGDLRVRQWFAAGDTVQISAVGAGFRVNGEGQAVSPGLEGQPARVRTESGRIVTGMPVAERRLELTL